MQNVTEVALIENTCPKNAIHTVLYRLSVLASETIRLLFRREVTWNFTTNIVWFLMNYETRGEYVHNNCRHKSILYWNVSFHIKTWEANLPVKKNTNIFSFKSYRLYNLKRNNLTCVIIPYILRFIQGIKIIRIVQVESNEQWRYSYSRVYAHYKLTAALSRRLQGITESILYATIHSMYERGQAYCAYDGCSFYKFIGNDTYRCNVAMRIELP